MTDNDSTPKLTLKQRIFIEEYLRCRNGTEAARRAGYSGNENTLAVTASGNLRKPAVNAEIQKRIADLSIESHDVKIKRRQSSTYVYLIQAENGLVKIGVTNNVERRFAVLSTSSPLELVLLFTFPDLFAADTEKTLHLKYALKHIRYEWFALTKDDIEGIRKTYVKSKR